MSAERGERLGAEDDTSAAVGESGMGGTLCDWMKARLCARCCCGLSLGSVWGGEDEDASASACPLLSTALPLPGIVEVSPVVLVVPVVI